MSWRRWRSGLVVAVLSAVLGGFLSVGIAPEITPEHLAWLIGLNSAKDILLWLKNHPVEEIDEL